MTLLTIKNDTIHYFGDLMCKTALDFEGKNMMKISKIFWEIGAWFYSKSDTPTNKFLT